MVEIACPLLKPLLCIVLLTQCRTLRFVQKGFQWDILVLFCLFIRVVGNDEVMEAIGNVS